MWKFAKKGKMRACPSGRMPQNYQSNHGQVKFEEQELARTWRLLKENCGAATTRPVTNVEGGQGLTNQVQRRFR